MSKQKIAARMLFDAGRYLRDQYDRSTRVEQIAALHHALVLLANLYNQVLGGSHVSRTQPL